MGWKKNVCVYLQLHEIPSIEPLYNLFIIFFDTRSEVQQERFAQDCLGNSLLNQIMSCDSVLAQWFPSALSLQFQEKRNFFSEAVDAVHALCSCDDHTGPQLNTIWLCISYLCLQHICTFFFIIAMQSKLPRLLWEKCELESVGVLECSAPWLNLNLAQRSGVTSCGPFFLVNNYKKRWLIFFQGCLIVGKTINERFPGVSCLVGFLCLPQVS